MDISSELMGAINEAAKEMRKNMPLSMVLLAELVREKMLAEGFPAQPTFADMVKSPTLLRWSSLVVMDDKEEQERLAKAWIDEIDAEAESNE